MGWVASSLGICSQLALRMEPRAGRGGAVALRAIGHRLGAGGMAPPLIRPTIPVPYSRSARHCGDARPLAVGKVGLSIRRTRDLGRDCEVPPFQSAVEPDHLPNGQRPHRAGNDDVREHCGGHRHPPALQRQSSVALATCQTIYHRPYPKARPHSTVCHGSVILGLLSFMFHSP